MSVACIQAQLTCQTEWLGQLALRTFLLVRQVSSFIDTRTQPLAQARQGVMVGRDLGKGSAVGFLLSSLRCQLAFYWQGDTKEEWGGTSEWVRQG